MLNTSIEDDTSFRIEYKNQKSLSWRFERKMLYFTAMSIHYKIRRNNNTDLNISRIQLQILSIHGKDINTFPMCMHCRRIRAWFHEEKQLERKEEKILFSWWYSILKEKEEFDENLKMYKNEFSMLKLFPLNISLLHE